MIKTKITEVFQEMGWPSAKPEQHQIVENRDVFVILPTGYGKSACYQCLPLLHKKMYPSKAPIIVLVVSPLRALRAIFSHTIVCVLGYYIGLLCSPGDGKIHCALYTVILSFICQRVTCLATFTLMPAALTQILSCIK